MKSLDGLQFSFQGLCWYTLVKDCSSEIPDFEITAKFEPRDDSVEGSIKTRTVAFNVTVGDEYVFVNRLDITRVSMGQLFYVIMPRAFS